MRKMIGRMLLWFIENDGFVVQFVKPTLANSHTKRPVTPLREGYVRKGGQNPQVSEVGERPPAPAPFRRKFVVLHRGEFFPDGMPTKDGGHDGKSFWT